MTIEAIVPSPYICSGGQGFLSMAGRRIVPIYQTGDASMRPVPSDLAVPSATGATTSVH